MLARSITKKEVHPITKREYSPRSKTGRRIATGKPPFCRSSLDCSPGQKCHQRQYKCYVPPLPRVNKGVKNTKCSKYENDICPEDFLCNTKTGRCVGSSGKIGRSIPRPASLSPTSTQQLASPRSLGSPRPPRSRCIVQPAVTVTQAVQHAQSDASLLRIQGPKEAVLGQKLATIASNPKETTTEHVQAVTAAIDLAKQASKTQGGELAAVSAEIMARSLIQEQYENYESMFKDFRTINDIIEALRNEAINIIDANKYMHEDNKITLKKELYRAQGDGFEKFMNIYNLLKNTKSPFYKPLIDAALSRALDIFTQEYAIGRAELDAAARAASVHEYAAGVEGATPIERQKAKISNQELEVIKTAIAPLKKDLITAFEANQDSLKDNVSARQSVVELSEKRVELLQQLSQNPSDIEEAKRDVEEAKREVIISENEAKRAPEKLKEKIQVQAQECVSCVGGTPQIARMIQQQVSRPRMKRYLRPTRAAPVAPSLISVPRLSPTIIPEAGVIEGRQQRKAQVLQGRVQSQSQREAQRELQEELQREYPTRHRTPSLKLPPPLAPRRQHIEPVQRQKWVPEWSRLQRSERQVQRARLLRQPLLTEAQREMKQQKPITSLLQYEPPVLQSPRLQRAQSFSQYHTPERTRPQYKPHIPQRQQQLGQIFPFSDELFEIKQELKDAGLHQISHKLNVSLTPTELIDVVTSVPTMLGNLRDLGRGAFNAVGNLFNFGRQVANSINDTINAATIARNERQLEAFYTKRITQRERQLENLRTREFPVRGGGKEVYKHALQELAKKKREKIYAKRIAQRKTQLEEFKRQAYVTGKGKEAYKHALQELEGKRRYKVGRYYD